MTGFGVDAGVVDATPRAGIRDGIRALEPEHWFLLFVLGATSFFDGYDRGILTIALKQIRGDFGLSSSEASWYLAGIYLGALPALFLTRRADRVGRRRLLMVSIAGYTLATAVSAVAPSAGTYAAAQFVAKLFLNAEAAIVWTMVAEELPAKARGFGFGWLGMCSALGVGFGALLFGFAFEPHGISWRWLYVAGLPALLMVTWLRRRLPESRRFTEVKRAGRLARRWQEILQPPHRKWLVLVITTTVLAEMTTHANTFTVDFLQTNRGQSTTTASAILVVAGAPGIPLMLYAGALSDRHGRRLVGCAFSLAAMAGVLAFFWIPGGAALAALFLAVALTGQLGSWPVLGAYGSELFPTALRGQAGSWTNIARAVGQVTSLGLGGLVLGLTDESFPITVTLLGIGPLVAVILFFTLFPETHGRELEDISG